MTATHQLLNDILIHVARGEEEAEVSGVKYGGARQEGPPARAVTR